MRIAGISELAVTISNAGASLFLFITNFTSSNPSVFLYLLACLTGAVAVFILFNRFKRLKGSQAFDQTMLGGLRHAVFVATYQIRLSLIGRWSIVPIAILCVGALFESGKPVWIVIVLGFLFLAVHFASGFEHRYYVSQKLHLEGLLKKLVQQG